MSWYESIRDTGSDSEYHEHCYRCSTYGCPDRKDLNSSWFSDNVDKDRRLRAGGPPEEFTLDNPACGCDSCVRWATRFRRINDCRNARQKPQLISRNGASAGGGGTISRYNDYENGTPQREYALHYTYYLNMPNIVHDVKEHDFASNGDEMHDKLSRKWPNINIISINQVNGRVN